VKLPWDPGLAVGVRLIDAQHQDLFRHVGALLEAMEQNRGRHEVGKVLAFLERYVVEHFAAEERLMAQHAYPQAAVHEQKHAEFVRLFLALRGELEQEGPTAGLAVKLNRTVCGWLRDHIGGTDRLLGQFLVGRGQGNVAA